MTTFAVYVKSTNGLSTSNPNLQAVGTRSGPPSRAGRAHLTATPATVSARTSGRQSHAQTFREEELETALDIHTDILPYDESGKRCYARACQKLDVVPSSYILSKLSNSKTLDCKHYGLGPKGTMALSIALVVNSRVTSINLRGNDIGEKGISYIQKMISENHIIQELNISDNKLGSFGAAAIHRMLLDNRSLRKLEMSGENFTDADAVLLAKPIQEHLELEHVDLSHNLFSDDSSKLFEDMISENSALQTLDLSWNQFRMNGARDIARGLKENAYLHVFNFSWNGIGDDGANEFAKALKVNPVLTSLDLTCCRIGHDGFMKLITSLSLNESLQHLRVGKNNIPEEFAEAAMSLLRSYPALKLETLDMSDCTFSPKFPEHVQYLQDMHRNVEVLHGYTSTYGKTKGDFMGDILREGLECLREFCKESGVTLVELFERFDADNSMSVSLQEFQEGLKEAGVPLSLYKIEMFAAALDKDGDGEVDYSKVQKKLWSMKDSEMVLQMKQAEAET